MIWDSETRKRWEVECQDARAMQRVHLAIAPRMTLTTFDGRRLQAGDELVPERDLRFERYIDTTSGGSDGLVERAVWQQVETLIATGVCLERDGPEPPRAA